MVDVDSDAFFNGAAAVISTIAILFFIFNVDLGYSPVSKILLAVAFLAGIFFITQRTEDHQLTLLGYGVVVTASVALFFDVVGTFEVGDELTVLGLLVVAGVLFYLRTRLDEDDHFVTGGQARRALVVVVVLTAGVLVVDVATGGLAYELQPESEIEYSEARGEEVRIASLVVTNPTPLPERVEAPNYAACTAGNWSAYRPETGPDEPEREVDAHVSVRDGYNEHVFGFGEETYPVLLHLHGENLQGETFPVQRTTACPDDETGSPYVALFDVTEDRRYATPA